MPYLQLQHGETYEIDVPGKGTVRFTKSTPVPDVDIPRDFIISQRLLLETVPLYDREGNPRGNVKRFKVVNKPAPAPRVEATQEELDALNAVSEMDGAGGLGLVESGSSGNAGVSAPEGNDENDMPPAPKSHGSTGGRKPPAPKSPATP